MEDVERTKYIIQPTYKKSVVEEQYWCNTISNDKEVKVKVNNVYRWGEFYIDLTDEEKEDLMDREMIELCDYEHELLSCWDGGCDFWIDIVNEEDFTEKELEEVEELLYKWKKEEDGGEAVSDRSPLEEEEGLRGFSQEEEEGLGGFSQEEEEGLRGFSQEKMEHNGWYETECEYVITSSCELEKVTEYECHE